jgi:ribosomal protein S27AE
LRQDLVALGIVFLIIGAIAAAYPVQYCLLGSCVTVGHPYQGIGAILIALAFIAIILGVALTKETVIRIQTQPSVSSGSNRFCVNCGQMVRLTDVFCPRCGQKRIT